MNDVRITLTEEELKRELRMAWEEGCINAAKIEGQIEYANDRAGQLLSKEFE